MTIAPDPNQGLIGGVSAAIQAAPELTQSPGLAVPIAQAGGDVGGNAQAAQHVANSNSFHQAVQHVAKSTGGGLLSGLWHTVSHVGSDVVGGIAKGASYVGQLANKPLNYVQHEYRYIHDVEARHGIWAGLGETAIALGGAAAAVGGVVAAPFTAGASLAVTAGVLGAEGAVAAESQLAYKDSWQRTTNGNSYLDPHTHQPVSLGRDFASGVLGEKPGTGTYKFMSGLGDAVGDLGLDPLQRVGTGVAASRVLRETISPGITAGDQIIHAADTNPRIARAFDVMAASDATDISRRFQKFAPLAKELGQAQSRDEVIQVLRNSFESNEFLVHGNRLPALGLTAIPVDKVRMAFADTKLARSQQLLASAFDPKTMAISNKEFDPMVRGNGLQVYRWLRGSGQTEEVSHTVANNFENADDLQQKIDIYRNGVFGAMKALASSKNFAGRTVSKEEAAVMADPEVQRRLYGSMQNITGGMYPGREAIYGHGPPGATEIADVTTTEGNTVAAAILDSQQGKLSFPSPDEMRKAAATLAGAKGLYGKADDFAYKHVTQNIFKRAVLSSFSFPMHVAGAEVALNALRMGAGNLIKSRVAATIGKLASKYGGDDMVNEMVANPKMHEAIGRYLYNMLPGKALQDGGQAAYLTELAGLTQFNGIVPDALQGMHGGSYIEDTPKDVMITSLRNGARKKGRVIGHDDFTSFSPGQMDPIDPRGGAMDPLGGQTRAWQQWLDQITKDPGSAVAANAYKAALDRGETEAVAHRKGVEQATLWLQDHPEIHPNLLRANLPANGWEGMDPLTAFAEAKMLNVRGATTGLDGTIHHDLLNAITEGHFRPGTGAGGVSGPIELGSVVHAADRANFGRVVAVHGDTATVHFVNRAEGTEARVDLPKDQLTLRGKGAAPGQPHLPDAITRQYLNDIPAKPMKTPGRLYSPDMTNALVMASDKLYSMIGGIINYIAREPVFGATSWKYMKQLQPSVDAGLITHEDAVTKSLEWASTEMIKFVHNIHEKTQFSESVRNFAPFFFAQQQAYKRVGRLLAENPGAFRKYQLMVTGIQNVGHNATDATGQNNFVVPGAGFLGAGVPAAMAMAGMPMANSSPVGFSGSLNSLSFVLPGATGISGLRPEMGPFVSVPVKAIASLFPEFTPAATTVIGPIAMNGALWKQFVPNALLDRVQEALSADSRGFQSAMMSTIQSLEYEQNVAEKAWIAGGRKGPGPSIVPNPSDGLMARQNFINRVKNQTRILYLVKAGLGFVSPLSPQLTVNDFGFHAKVTAAIKKAGSVSGGMSDFLKANPDASPFTVFQSTDPSGYTLPESVQAENWINANMGLIHQYPGAAAWLMPQLTDTTYNSTVYNEQLAQGIRVRRTPEEFLTALYVAAGNQQYYGVDQPAYQKALQSGNYDSAALHNDFATYTRNYGMQNPIWYDDFQSKDRVVRRQETMKNLTALLASGKAPAGPMTSAISGLLNDYAMYQSAIAQGVDTKVALTDDFQAYLVKVGKETPMLKPFILSVLGPLTSMSGASFSQASTAGGLAG